MILAVLLAVALFLVGLGVLLGWWLRGDETDDAFWSGYATGLAALGYVYDGVPR